MSYSQPSKSHKSSIEESSSSVPCQRESQSTAAATTSFPTSLAAAMLRHGSHNEMPSRHLLPPMATALPTGAPISSLFETPMATAALPTGAGPSSLFEIALWQRRLALEEQQRATRYLQVTLARQQAAAATLGQPGGIIALNTGVGGLLRRRQAAFSQETKKQQDYKEGGSPSLKRRLVGCSKQSKPRSSNTSLKSFPLPAARGEGRTIKIGSFDRYKRKWDTIVAATNSRLPAANAAKKGFVRRAFSNAIHKNRIEVQQESVNSSKTGEEPAGKKMKMTPANGN